MNNAGENGGDGDGARSDDGETDSHRDYEVGYRRPPKKHYFKPGNDAAKGRRQKRLKSLRGDLLAELASSVGVAENGKQKRVTKQRLVIRSAVHGGIKDSGAAVKVANLIAQLLPDDTPVEERQLTPDEQAILDAIFGAQKDDK